MDYKFKVPSLRPYKKKKQLPRLVTTKIQKNLKGHNHSQMVQAQIMRNQRNRQMKMGLIMMKMMTTILMIL